MTILDKCFPILAAAALLGACGTESPEPAPTTAPDPAPRASAPPAAAQDPEEATSPNLLLVTVDAMRADRIGAWGYEAARTPNLDGLAERGARFTRAYAHVPWSLPAHACLLTGTYPPENGIRDNGRSGLSAGLTTLAAVCRERGYATGAFVASLALQRDFGLDRGFDLYDDDMGQQIGTRGVFLERRAEAVVDSALTWLKRSKAPFFAWIHLTDPRLGHEPPAAFVMDDPYDGELAYVDAEIGRLGEWLAADPARENTVFVVVAAHGESLGEKGETAHGSLLYEGTQHIPLFVSWPGRVDEKRVIDDLVGQVDLLPTLLELGGWPPLAQASGRSFAPLLLGKELPPRPVFLENDFCALSFGWSPLRGVVEERWKYLQAPTPELYDLAADPGEEHNLAEAQPEVTARLAAELDGWRAGLRTRLAEPVRNAADTVRILYQLTLTLSMGRGVVGEPGVGINPVDQMELLELYHDAVRLGHLVQVDRMAEPLQRIVTEYPEFVAGHILMGELDTLRGRFEEARAQQQMAVDLDPENALAHFFLARAYQSLGYHAEAMVHYQVVLELDPEDIGARQPLARLLVIQRDIPAAIDQYREIVKASPDQVRHWVNFANLLRDQKQWKELADALQHATELEPEAWNTVNFYAWILATAPDEEARDGLRAVELAERMAQFTPGDIVVMDTLAAAYAECGRWGMARDTARRALLLAEGRGTPEQVQELTARLALYTDEKPFREEE